MLESTDNFFFHGRGAFSATLVVSSGSVKTVGPWHTAAFSSPPLFQLSSVDQERAVSKADRDIITF